MTYWLQHKRLRGVWIRCPDASHSREFSPSSSQFPQHIIPKALICFT